MYCVCVCYVDMNGIICINICLFLFLMNFGFFFRGNVYLFMWVRLGYRWVMYVGNFIVWSMEFI